MVRIALATVGEQPIAKITEKYERNPAVDAETDVRKLTFFIADGKIVLHYHYGTGV